MGKILDTQVGKIQPENPVLRLQNENAALRRLAALLWTAFECNCTRDGDVETYEAIRAKALALGVAVEGGETWERPYAL